METAPEFSVIIVNFNAGAFLQGAIDSLKAQTYRNFEVILIDNASTDGSLGTLDTDGLPAFTLMREAGVLNCEKRGLNIYYSLACDCLGEFLRCVDKLACGGKKTKCC